MDKRHSLNSIVQELLDRRVDFDHMSEKDLAVIKNVCNKEDGIVWLIDHRKIKPVFINDYGRQFFGVSANDEKLSGLTYEHVLHPDHFTDLHKRIVFFTDHPKEVHKMTYYVKVAGGDYRWTYSEARGISFDFAGRPTYILSVVYDIDSCLTSRDLRKNPPNYQDVSNRIELLTPREKEILILISSELSSQQIAELLFIEPTTVDSHRKHIIRKLQVRSSIGLVRYALLYMPQ